MKLPPGSRGSRFQAVKLSQRVCSIADSIKTDDALIRKLRSLGVSLSAGARAARRNIYRLVFQSSDSLTPQMRDEYLVDMLIDFERMSRERSRQRRKSNVPNLGPPGTRMHTFETPPCYEAPGAQWRVALNTPRGPRAADLIVPDNHVRGATFTVQLPLRKRRARRSRRNAGTPRL